MASSALLAQSCNTQISCSLAGPIVYDYLHTQGHPFQARPVEDASAFPPHTHTKSCAESNNATLVARDDLVAALYLCLRGLFGIWTGVSHVGTWCSSPEQPLCGGASLDGNVPTTKAFSSHMMK